MMQKIYLAMKMILSFLGIMCATGVLALMVGILYFTLFQTPDNGLMIVPYWVKVVVFTSALIGWKLTAIVEAHKNIDLMVKNRKLKSEVILLKKKLSLKD